MNSLKWSLTRKQPLESPLSGGANLFLNHHMLLPTVTTRSAQLSIPPLSKALLPNIYLANASLKCNHWLPPQLVNFQQAFPEPDWEPPPWLAGCGPASSHISAAPHLHPEATGEAQVPIKQ